jgi:superkiller protein 3
VKDLPAIYKELLQLAPEKYSDYYTKLTNLAMNEQLQDHTELLEIFCHEIKLENIEEERKYLALKNLLSIFMKNREVAMEKYKEEFFECLEVGISDVNHMYHVDIYTHYFKILHHKQRFNDLVKAAEEMTTIYSNNVIPLEWICKVYIENDNNESFKINESLKNNFGSYVEKLLEINSNSILALTASAFTKFAIGDFVGSRDILNRVNELQPNWSIILRKLSQIHRRFRAFLLAELVLRQLKNVEHELAEALIEQQVEEKILEGIDICKNNKDDLNFLKLKAKGHIYLKQFTDAENVITSIEKNLKQEDVLLLKAILHRFKDENEKSVEILSETESHESFLESAQNLFALKRFDDCLVNVLKATKLDPNNSECFYMLGKVYITINDETRCRKCLEKCLNLNPQNEKAISVLSAIYRKNANWSENLQILENSMKSVNGSYQKTACFQLGLHHLAQQNYENAITSFRNSLKYNTESVECWEGLGDAYLARGSYNSALKVFEKSVELNPLNNYAQLQIAKIKYVLQQYQESIADYEELLELMPDYIPALKGIAESHFGRAYYLYENHRTGRARDHCQQILAYLERAIKLEPTFMCLWRLLANVLDFIASFPINFDYLIIPAAIICENESKKLSGDELFDLASKCYSRCLKINKQDDFVWFDLIVNYYKRSMHSHNDSGTKIEFIKLAFEGAKHLVKLSPLKWQNWNLLGIIASSKDINEPALSQHCFVKALHLDKKTFTSWSNLGIFYLIHGDIQLANKAFGRAQQSDVSFLNAWIGQSVIAELINEKDEAMDLLRHCTQLGFHHESSIGYANYVCSILNEPNYAEIPKYEYAIDKMYAIPLALDNINWHCLMKSETSFEAWSYIGYLSKCQRLHKQAVDAYENAVKYAKDDSQKDKCLIDLGYCYLKVNNHKKSIKAFGDVKEATFSSTIGLALAYYRGKLFSFFRLRS